MNTKFKMIPKWQFKFNLNIQIGRTVITCEVKKNIEIK